MTAVFFLATFLSGIIITILTKRAAERLKFYDFPKDHLKDHSAPVPYTGTAVFITFMLLMIALRFFTSYETGTLHQLRGVVLGGTIIYVLGLIDDIYDLDFKVKFLWQVIAACFLIYYGIYIKFFPHKILNIPLSIFWVIFVVNAVNIIDILDGLSVGVASIAALGFFLITLPTEMLYVNYAAIILSSTLAAFWFFNKPPAKIFMGDAGSLFTGFVLAALSMGADYSKVNVLGLFSPVLILGIPLYDTVLVSFLRWKKGLTIFKGSKDHYALRLSVAGFSPWQIDIISYSISIILALAAFLITVLAIPYAVLVLTIVFMSAFIGAVFLESIDIEKK